MRAGGNGERALDERIVCGVRVGCLHPVGHPETLWRPTGQLIPDPELIDDAGLFECSDEVPDAGQRSGPVVRIGDGDAGRTHADRH